ncbi:2-oxo acid dehydrogenase subunit E2 [Mycolicibacterium baixiangningiae]|uniref:2-oxo acid dehydrogenase subunit E2 n=1 Tax=Mycolicibacterium baixiangningiae TaxID=2761578 RepID=UPI0018668B5C|nr:2-oxo acid dehydrogenase subunit E2 [Mycolicibacterium baixiangningiae]
MTAAETHIAVTVAELGEAVTEATITRWLKSVGDTVEDGEPLLEVATDKVDTEIPAPAAGILAEILEPEDAVVAVGATIARIAAAPPVPEADPQPQTTQPVAAQPPAPAETSPTQTEQKTAFPQTTLATSAPPPLTDAEQAVPVITEQSDRVEKMPRIRRTIARRMMESLQTAAQLTTVVEVDLSLVAASRAKHKQAFLEQTGVKLSFLPFVVVAAVEGLIEHPIINASVDADCTEITYYRSVHLGMAVDSKKGLMVPVIRDAQDHSIAAVSRAIAASANAVRDGAIRPDELTGGTFTITNTGSRGALFDTPIINQPQSAILGIGAVVERLVPQRDNDGSLLIRARSMAHLSLSYDHRIVDGADAARYLTTVRTRLENGFSDDEVLVEVAEGYTATSRRA